MSNLSIEVRRSYIYVINAIVLEPGPGHPLAECLRYTREFAVDLWTASTGQTPPVLVEDAEPKDRGGGGLIAL